MQKVKCFGILRHRFHGDYSAVIGLQFKDSQEASDALRTLGVDWKPGKDNPNILVGVFGKDSLDEVKVRFKEWGLTISPCGYRHCKDKCKGAEIDNISHSIDVGAKFEVEIPCVPGEQAILFGKEI